MKKTITPYIEVSQCSVCLPVRFGEFAGYCHFVSTLAWDLGNPLLLSIWLKHTIIRVFEWIKKKYLNDRQNQVVYMYILSCTKIKDNTFFRLWAFSMLDSYHIAHYHWNVRYIMYLYVLKYTVEIRFCVAILL